jgi:hypothetical protein
MNLFEICTTAYMEENFLLITNLELNKIQTVIESMVTEERENNFFYSNEDYLLTLKHIYPKNYIEIHIPEKIHF